MSNQTNPLVFLELDPNLDGRTTSRLIIELFVDQLPDFAHIFQKICVGDFRDGEGKISDFSESSIV